MHFRYAFWGACICILVCRAEAGGELISLSTWGSHVYSSYFLTSIYYDLYQYQYDQISNGTSFNNTYNFNIYIYIYMVGGLVAFF